MACPLAPGCPRGSLSTGARQSLENEGTTQMRNFFEELDISKNKH